MPGAIPIGVTSLQKARTDKMMQTGVHRRKVAHGMTQAKLPPINLHRRPKLPISAHRLEFQLECPIWTHPINPGTSRFKRINSLRPVLPRQPEHGVRRPVEQTIGALGAIKVHGVRLRHPKLRHLPHLKHQRHRRLTTIHGAHLRAEQAVVATQPGAATQTAGDKARQAEVKTQFQTAGQRRRNSHKAGAMPAMILIRAQTPQFQRLQQCLLQNRQQLLLEPGAHRVAPAVVGDR